MNNQEKITLYSTCIDMTKAALELRGKEYLKVYLAFTKYFAKYFKDQSDYFLAYVDRNAHLFPGEDGVTIEKVDEFADLFPDSDTIDEVASYLVTAHMVGQDGTNKEVTTQVGTTIKTNNIDADDYATARAGELMSGVTETTKQEVRDLFNKGWTQNWSVSQISDAIQEQFSSFSVYRANLIATMEVGNAYEVGKKEQFKRYQSEFGVVGWKRSQTQGDSAVRPSHIYNELMGWIPENEPFAGTDTDSAPHGFNCRCVTLRRITPPETSDIVAVQFAKDGTSYLTDTDKLDITNVVQDVRKDVSILPQFSALTDYQGGDGSVARYVPKKNVIAINALEWGAEGEYGEGFTVAAQFFSGLEQKKAVIAHEMGHYLDDFLGTAEGIYREKSYANIYDELVQSSMELLGKWQTGEIQGTEYPLYTIDKSGQDKGLSELFAEAFSAYIMGDMSVLDERMISFFNFISGK